jgi:uncharacterized membrane protein
MLERIPFRIAWLGITLSSVFLFVLTATYFSFCSQCSFLLEKQDVVFNPFWRTAFYIHISGGMVALLLGPFQFVPAFRNRFLKAHRTVGKLYLGAILFFGAPAGLFMAFYAEGGWIGQLGFCVMAVLWLLSTWMALEAIRKRKIPEHRNWMTRSFALTFAAVTLRLYVPLASDFLHWNADFVETSSAWVSWVPNLIVAEILLRFAAKKL